MVPTSTRSGSFFLTPCCRITSSHTGTCAFSQHHQRANAHTQRLTHIPTHIALPYPPPHLTHTASLPVYLPPSHHPHASQPPTLFAYVAHPLRNSSPREKKCLVVLGVGDAGDATPHIAKEAHAPVHTSMQWAVHAGWDLLHERLVGAN